MYSCAVRRMPGTGLGALGDWTGGSAAMVWRGAVMIWVWVGLAIAFVVLVVCPCIVSGRGNDDEDGF